MLSPERLRRRRGVRVCHGQKQDMQHHASGRSVGSVAESLWWMTKPMPCGGRASVLISRTAAVNETPISDVGRIVEKPVPTRDQQLMANQFWSRSSPVLYDGGLSNGRHEAWGRLRAWCCRCCAPATRQGAAGPAGPASSSCWVRDGWSNRTRGHAHAYLCVSDRVHDAGDRCRSHFPRIDATRCVPAVRDGCPASRKGRKGGSASRDCNSQGRPTPHQD